MSKNPNKAMLCIFKISTTHQRELSSVQADSFRDQTLISIADPLDADNVHVAPSYAKEEGHLIDPQMGIRSWAGFDKRKSHTAATPNVLKNKQIQKTNNK